MPLSPTPVLSIYKLIPSGRVQLCLDPMEIAGLGNSLDLPGRPVTGLGQDARGYLWLGTENGALLFDGLHCVAPPALAGLQGSIVFDFCFGDDQALWIGTHGTGLARVCLGTTGPRVEGSLTEAQGLPSNYIHSLSMDRRHRLWVGTPEGIAVIERGVVVGRLGVDNGLPSTKVQALYCDGRGRVWAGTDAGLRVLSDDSIDRDFVQRPCMSEAVARIHGDSRGRIWVGMRNGALFRVVLTEDGPARCVAVRASGAAILALCCDRQGRLWMGTDQGVQVYDNDVLCDSFTITDGLPSPIVRALLRDGDGRMWAGTQKGLVMLAGPASPAHPLGGNGAPQRGQAWNFAHASDSRTWLATDTGLCLVDTCSERPLLCPELPALLGETTVWSLCPDHDGQLWVGTRRHGLFCLDEATGALRAHLLADDMVGVVALCLVGERHLWAASPRHGVVCVDTQTKRILHQVDQAAGLHEAGALALGLDQRGRLWGGTISGRLVCIDPHRGVVVQTIDLGSAAGPHLIQHLAFGQDGVVWVCTNGSGLLGVDPAQAAVVRSVTAADGLPSDLLYACRIDDEGNLWLATGRGVTRLEPASGQVATIDQSFGLPHEECNFGALCFDGRGQLWVGTVSGVAIVDPARLPDSARTCPVYLTGFRVMGEEHDLATGLELEDSAYDVQFEFAAVSFTAPHAVRYRAQLCGLEADWSPPTWERTRRYTNLRPGAYSFRVSAGNWAGVWSPPLEVPFRVVRNHQAREVEERLERERIEKAVYRATAARLEELNRQLVETDRLKTALITRIQAQAALFERLSLHDELTSMLNRRAVDAALAAEFSRARRAGTPFAVALADLDHFKQINDTHGHHIGDLVLQIVGRLCTESLRAIDTAGRFGGEEFAFLLPLCNAQDGILVCERVRTAIAGYDWSEVASGLRVTISVGVADWPAALDHVQLLQDADRYLYEAKRRGRNRVCGPAPREAALAKSGTYASGFHSGFALRPIKEMNEHSGACVR